MRFPDMRLRGSGSTASGTVFAGFGRPVPERLGEAGIVRGWSRGNFGLDSRFPSAGGFIGRGGGSLVWAGRMAVDGGLEFADAPEQVLLPLAVALLEFLVAPAMFSLYLRVAAAVGCEDLARLPGFLGTPSTGSCADRHRW